jgi:hypothetical protein
MLKYLVLFIFLVTLFSCIREIDFRNQDKSPQLIVEGMISNENQSCSVKISYTSKTFNNYQNDPVKDAKVSIYDDLGNSVILVHNKDTAGLYTPTNSNFHGIEGRTYTLKIITSDGKQYLSKPEKILPVVPIYNITYSHNPKADKLIPSGIDIYVDFYDPPIVDNYYLWRTKVISKRVATGIVDSSLNSPICTLAPGDSCKKVTDFNFYDYTDCFCSHVTCWVNYGTNSLVTLSDASVNGSFVKKNKTLFSPIYWTGNQYVEVKQFSVSRTCYAFWKRYEQEVNRTGDLYDPQPAPLEGNIYNTDDGTEVVLGYFTVASVATKRLLITNNDLVQAGVKFDYLYLSEYIQRGDCRLIWPNSSEQEPVNW